MLARARTGLLAAALGVALLAAPGSAWAVDPDARPRPDQDRTPVVPDPCAAAARPAPSARPTPKATPGATAAATAAATATATATASPTPPAPGSAAALALAAQRQQTALAAQQRRLADATAAASRVLECWARARLDADGALRRARAQQAALAAATGRLAAARAELGDYAAVLYREGGLVGSTTGGKARLLLGSGQVSDGLYLLGALTKAGAVRGDAVAALAEAEQVQRQAVVSSAAAAADLAGAQARATRARRAAEAVIAQARAGVQAATTRLAADQQAAQRALYAEAVARARSGRARAFGGPGAALVGTCKGGDLTGYANGLLPVAALCPLWGAPGQLLRADAAAAFEVLSKRYGAQFGVPLCVTDSYRPLAAQVAVKQAKPELAAQPGTSDHGWGLAVDLCGGVERFGTPQHAWLLANALSVGFYHPAWAEPWGSLPEPWHWEYAGG